MPSFVGRESTNYLPTCLCMIRYPCQVRVAFRSIANDTYLHDYIFPPPIAAQSEMHHPTCKQRSMAASFSVS